MDRGSNHTWVGDPPPWASLFDEDNKEGSAIMTAVISDVLEKLLEANEELPTPRTITRFNSLKPPAISVRGYLDRIMKYAPCSRQCFVLALVYMDRIVECNPTFQLTSFNIHRLLIASVLVASKFFDDLFFNNTYFSKVGGVSARELDGLELELLFLCDWHLHVLPSTFADYCTQLLRRAPTRQPTAVTAATMPAPASPRPRLAGPATASPSGSRPISIPGRAAASGESPQRGRDQAREKKSQPAMGPGKILVHIATSDDSDDSTSSGDTEYEDSHSYSEPTPAPPRLRPTPRSNSPSPFMGAMQRAGRFSGTQSGDSEEESPTSKTKMGGSPGHHNVFSPGSDGMHGMCEIYSGGESDGVGGEGKDGERRVGSTPSDAIRKTPDIFPVETDDLAGEVQKVHLECTTDGPT